MLKVLCVFATKQESFSFPRMSKVKIRTLICGAGKINATLNLCREMQDKMPDVILNLGVSGSYRKKDPILSLHQINHFKEADMPVMISSSDIHTTYPEALYHYRTLFTYDKPVYKNLKHNPHNALVDMEGYALAKTAFVYQVPFFCFKVVSDHCSKNSSAVIKKNLPMATDLFREKIPQILNYILLSHGGIKYLLST